MTRFPASGGGSGPPYTYAMDGYPDDAEEGESLYHITEDAAYVYTGSTWVEQTVTNHGQLAGISAADHHDRYSDSEASDAAPVQSVNNETGDVSLSEVSTETESVNLDGNERTFLSKPNGTFAWTVDSASDDIYNTQQNDQLYIARYTGDTIVLENGSTSSVTAVIKFATL